jgi:hypothetical protein
MTDQPEDQKPKPPEPAKEPPPPPPPPPRATNVTMARDADPRAVQKK